MKQRTKSWRLLCAVLPALVLLGSCFSQSDADGPGKTRTADGGFSPFDRDTGAADVSDGGTCGPGRTLDPSAQCQPIHTAEPLPLRSVVSDQQAASADVRYTVGDLYDRFYDNCHTCHVDANLGNFQVNRGTFAQRVDATLLARIKSDDPAFYMPQQGSANARKYSERPAGDPVRVLAELIDTWLKGGKPDSFEVPANLGGQSKYFMQSDQAASLTNLGTCLPDPGLVSTDVQEMCELDARFAAMQKDESSADGAEYLGLPVHLEDTDLSTFDTKILAQRGVIAYAPTYPLWSDDAGKLRYVRVPLGQSIHYDADTREFEIPPNTRFYKTFLKKIVEKDGKTHFRKVETRLIVSRPNEGSLFGTYIWNENETTAELHLSTLNSGRPFSDKILTLVTDEPRAAEILAGDPANPEYALDDARPPVRRRYAVPSSERCIQCHMGSPSRSFVLGFSPVQIHRRPQGEGGVIEPAGPDELTQLDRLIQYGVITGLSSAADVVPLERSQEPRVPRNDYELRAQAYMTGNCGHCHNPNGFPSQRNPDLKPLLDFWPSRDGGIFQFPVDRVSPKIHRGTNGEVPVPYIAPLESPECPDARSDQVLIAPWRSAIYRNVDTPFPYAFDSAIFPHMPMNTPGYDCRVPAILSDWMISIPVRSACGRVTSGVPFEEVKPGEPGYSEARADAEAHLALYHSAYNSRYGFCPDTSDILDHNVVWNVLDLESGLPQITPLDDEQGAQCKNPTPLLDPNACWEDGVPDRPHWAVADFSERPGDWVPRRADWRDFLVDHKVSALPTALAQGSDPYINARNQRENELDVLKQLDHITLTDDFKQRFAYAPDPNSSAGARAFGLWEAKAGCDLSKERKVSDFPEAQWLKTKAPELFVYTWSAGEAIFNMICINCHGPAADGKGLQSSALADMTGNQARVANLRDGLFGPVGSGANRARVFGDPNNDLPSGLGADDWASHYLAWMALGGTLARIPPDIMNLVGHTPVLGVKREGFAIQAHTANMLSVAQQLCRSTLPDDIADSTWYMSDNGRPFTVGAPLSYGDLYLHTPLITVNGDAELWVDLCNYGQSPPVRAVTAWIDTGAEGSPLKFRLATSATFYGSAVYPSDRPVGNVAGGVDTGIQPGNYFPWCVKPPEDPQVLAQVQLLVTADNKPLPLCPSEVLTPENHWDTWNLHQTDGPDGKGTFRDDYRTWSARGAINAGLAVFEYLDQIVAHGRQPKPRYDQCELLTADAGAEP